MAADGEQDAMKDVAQILKSKLDQTVYTVWPSASVFDAVKLMTQKNLGARLVLDGDEFIGIISERDCARKMVLADRSSKESPARDIMSSPVQYVITRHNNDERMQAM